MSGILALVAFFVSVMLANGSTNPVEKLITIGIGAFVAFAIWSSGNKH